MPWLPLYLLQQDFSTLLGLLDDEVAFIVSDGPGRWRATRDKTEVHGERLTLWHVPSGPLPLLAAAGGLQDSEVSDPWSGWTERRTGADPGSPFFGSARPGVVWLNVRITPRDAHSICGVSSFEWIGNRYAPIGKPAPEATKKWWSRLGRSVAKSAEKVPRGGPGGSGKAEIWAFPHVLDQLQRGATADQSSWP